MAGLNLLDGADIQVHQFGRLFRVILRTIHSRRTLRPKFNSWKATACVREL